MFHLQPNSLFHAECWLGWLVTGFYEKPKWEKDGQPVAPPTRLAGISNPGVAGAWPVVAWSQD